MIADLCLKIEADIRAEKCWHRRLLTPFAKAARTYDLICDGDRIAVCISGGKDSMLMAKLFQELRRHRRRRFDLKFLVMDPGYDKDVRLAIVRNARLLGVPIEIFESDIFNAAYTTDRNPCYLCARMRRGNLYATARDMGCNKIALGHHFDDVIETTLMGMLWGGQIQTMLPKLKSKNFEGMELIRPMYLVREDDIIRWRDAYGLEFIRCACRMTKKCSDEGQKDPSSKRLQTKMLIKKLKENNPFVEGNIFRSMENICLDMALGWKENGTRHTFLDDYDA